MFVDEVKHQGGAQRTLQRAVGRDRVPHAYIFHGPDGVGKETLAGAFARLLLCPNRILHDAQVGSEAGEIGLDRSIDACGRCDDCRLAAAGNHPDLHVIYRQLIREHPDSEVRRRKGLELGVDVIRHFVIDKVGLTPLRGRAKVFLIRDADRITPQAQNSLLKTLEEPPGPAYIVLLVKALDRLLPTTLSRCQIVRFDALPTAFVREQLGTQRPDLPVDQADWYARLAGGSVGRALGFVDDGLFEVNRRIIGGLARRSAHGQDLAQEWIDQAKALGEQFTKAGKSRSAAASAAGAATLGSAAGDPDITDTEATRRGLKLILLLAANWHADVIRIQSGDADLMVNRASHAELERAGHAVSTEDAIEMVNRIARAERQLDLNAHPQLCMEVLAADLLIA